MGNLTFGEVDWNAGDSGGGSSSNDFMRLEQGENVVRVMGNPVQFYVHWINTTDGGKRKIVSGNKNPELIIVEKGNMVFTPPLVEHCMKFPKDTLFLTLSRNPRDQASYESDVVRVNLVDPSDSISWRPNDF